MKSALSSFLLFATLFTYSRDSPRTYIELPNDIKWTSFLDNNHKKPSISNGNYKDSKTPNWIFYFSVKDSLIDGQLSCKDSNGVIRETATYMRGIRNGRSQHFINGRLSVTQFYFDGSTYEEIFYYKSGLVKKRYQLITLPIKKPNPRMKIGL